MSKDLNYPVAYLELQDFDEDGNLISKQLKNKPVMIMIQAGWCGACSAAKPEFQKFADSLVAHAATIQNDGQRDSERQLAAIIDLLYPEKLIGFPSYLLITVDGRKLAYNGPRDSKSLERFVLLNQ